MPVIFCGAPVVTTKKPVSGRQSFNEAIKKLAPAIEEAGKNGHYGVQEIADYLNDNGFVAPNGRRFTYTTLHRMRKYAPPCSTRSTGSDRLILRQG